MIDDFRDFVAELLRAEVRFLIVGAHALSVHGVPRATVDLDIWIDRTPENARRTWNALVSFGAPVDDLDVSQDDLVRPNVVVQLGLPPYRIDVMTGVSGIGFEEAWPDRVQHSFEGVMAPFLGRDCLIRNKRATGRHKDLGDVEALGEGVQQ